MHVTEPQEAALAQEEMHAEPVCDPVFPCDVKDGVRGCLWANELFINCLMLILSLIVHSN
jgi:hypothetical protein